MPSLYSPTHHSSLSPPHTTMSCFIFLFFLPLLLPLAHSTTTTHIPVLYDSTAMDHHMQMEMLKAVFLSLRTNDPHDKLHPHFLDLAHIPHWLPNPNASTIISLISPTALAEWSAHYHAHTRPHPPPLITIFTPRLLLSAPLDTTPSITIFSLQMDPRALSVALLHRVEKVGTRTLVPILDSHSPSQLLLLQHFVEAAEQRLLPIRLTSPLFLDQTSQLPSTFRHLVGESGGAGVGVLLLAEKGSQRAMELAADKKDLQQVGWFSPNILQHEEWAYININNTTTTPTPGQEEEEGVSPYFGLYTLEYVGGAGWDSPSRRRVLRQLSSYTGASPRVLSAVLAYDSASLAALHALKTLQLPHMGLSGKIAFDRKGCRREGMFFGVSAVPDLASPAVTLLQPSTWILEDRISLMQTLEGQFLIKEYEVATSSLLTATELKALANHSRLVEEGCESHMMNLVTHDPFNQMPYHYYFTMANLPQSILIPNSHGFAITLLCIHSPHTTTSLQIACTPPNTPSQGVNCFRSHLNRRQKRDVPLTQYSLHLNNKLSPQNSKWSSSGDEVPSHYPFYQSNNPTPAYPFRRQGFSVSAAAEVSTSPSPAPTSKLPELRQILKAAKPFVGSCIGSTTGCAMCVLVLGRLPLGAVPAACTGPCFVGTFGSCGSLLGRVFSETTVICTELFRQGRMDPETFFADAEFGRLLTQRTPTTMQGYTLLASPLVELMRHSVWVSQIISLVALPWANHIKFLMGRSNEPNLGGLVVHTVGAPICNLVGHIYSLHEQEQVTLLVLALTTILLLLLHRNIKKRRDEGEEEEEEGRSYWKRWGMMM